MREISGDRPTSFAEKLLYLGYNLLRGIAGHSPRFKPRYWHSGILDAGADSPGRKKINQFFYKELPGIVPAGELSVLDVGCGSGYLRSILAESGYHGLYTGIDIRQRKDFLHYENSKFKSTFYETGIENYNTHLKYDLVITNTVLEHIQDDEFALKKCHAMCADEGFQIHIVPTFWSLLLYLWHGYRQYTPRRMIKLFCNKKNQVYRLGGVFSFLLHLLFITFPEIFFRSGKLRESSIYTRLVEICSKMDRIIPVCSSLYVVVISRAVREA
ncbi:MAG: class I SAM-dependent methyltransferase [Spirochaetaceae bacterium]|nr:MAG: class I SAM-dependent methyltransferase [Spirochaetaceae bacterium]